ncbi:tRNA (adenosine(37)-N6)-threonylcarbamoyltransferase complex ATPase subunit type 1 TsaE [Phosphitispora fastidiosa]|uniref:tRNA (adenosine(37)-N6)-threonylcarbamoyltransferase complex ATPase subunit type 1 TsaE n=1 Tax=Phosphitispora fastidiosa TaxID=2837202 RepID=UPI001E3078DB|nr:tRNA (adenosine(37)-N6)-threonylcarbamoyltransferase complex ATPase subunit type 1 TsaE [Phosphitispora fastidiosa]MBU7008438.1 tRNA threonylcarbamoyladenosine biosynthesis protein TsaE [Phosphitispora fastidiosa]
MRVFSDSTEKTITIGQSLGRMLGAGSVVCLEGDLGAGKTHFAKGIALGLDISEHVTSPTFTIINEYEGRLPLYHVDAYRLEEEEEAYELGLEEYLFGSGVTLIEWPERVTGLLPDEYLTVSIIRADKGDNSRELEFLPCGQSYVDLTAGLFEELKKIVHIGD